jgi:hypothetical protein
VKLDISEALFNQKGLLAEYFLSSIGAIGKQILEWPNS